jgi:hypothetical protein
VIVDTSTLSHIWWLSPYILSLQTIPECTVISFGKRLIIQNETLMNFKQLCQIWTCKSIQQNVRFECQTISENIHKLKQGLSSTLYKFKDIQGLGFLFSNSRTFRFCTNPVIFAGNVEIFLVFFKWLNSSQSGALGVACYPNFNYAFNY